MNTLRVIFSVFYHWREVFLESKEEYGLGIKADGVGVTLHSGLCLRWEESPPRPRKSWLHPGQIISATRGAMVNFVFFV